MRFFCMCVCVCLSSVDGHYTVLFGTSEELMQCGAGSGDSVLTQAMDFLDGNDASHACFVFCDLCVRALCCLWCELCMSVSCVCIVCSVDVCLLPSPSPLASVWSRARLPATIPLLHHRRHHWAAVI